MKLPQNTRYTIDHINAIVTLGKAFLKEAAVIGSASYHEMLRLRNELPNYTFKERETKKIERTKIGRRLTYLKMEHYIETKEGKESPLLAEFKKVTELAKIQNNPYSYTKDWFLKLYKDDFVTCDPTDEPAADNSQNIIEIAK